jgi:uncharacterized protein DUF6299
MTMLSRPRARVLLAALAAAALALSVTTPVLAQAPSNDDFDNAMAIAELPFSDSLNTAEATTAADDPDCAGRSHTVWYVFTPASDVEVSANTFGSDYDTTLSAYTGARGALTQIACNDDSGSLQSRISFAATGGVTYHLMVGSFDESPGGNLQFTIQELPPRLTLGLTIDPTGSVSRAGVATVHGTVTCSRDAPGIFILGTIRQQVSKKVAAVATYSATVDCTDTSAWSASAAGETAPFKRGDAQVIASVSYFDEGRGEIVRARASRTVRLQ